MSFCAIRKKPRISQGSNYHGNFPAESGRHIPVVNREWVIRVGSIAADVNDDAELTSGAVLDHLLRDERGDLGHQINTVQHDIVIQDLGKGTALLGLLKIPLGNMLEKSNLGGKLESTLAAATQRTDNDGLGRRSCLGNRPVYHKIKAHESDRVGKQRIRCLNELIGDSLHLSNESIPIGVRLGQGR